MMTRTTLFRSLTYVACSCMLLVTLPLHAQEPTLANEPARGDLGNLLHTAVQSRGSSASRARVKVAAPVARFARRVPDALPRAESHASTTTDEALRDRKPFQPVVHGTAPDLGTHAGQDKQDVEVICRFG